MILRRLNEHVRAQNWLAVGLDFLIVVAGVYLGIALGDWHDAREAAAEERIILNRLSKEFAFIEAELEALHERSERIEQDLDALIATLESDDPSRDVVVKGISAVTEATFEPPVSATYIELRNGGGLSRIREDGIRTALIEYATMVERNEPWYDLYVGFFGGDAILVRAGFTYTLDGEEVGIDEQAMGRLRTSATALRYHQVAQSVQSQTIEAAIGSARTVRQRIDTVQE